MSTIEKIAVYDARIIQEAPKYAVQKGALAVSVSPFNAISASAGQLLFQILVPSLNVFVDRKIDLITGANVYAEAVPSQYSSVESTNAVTSTGFVSMVPITTPDVFSPSSTMVGNLELSKITGYDPVKAPVQAGTKFRFPAGSLALGVFQYVSGGGTSSPTAVWSYVSGANPSIAAALAAQIGYTATFAANGGTAGANTGTVSSISVSGANWSITMSANFGTAPAGTSQMTLYNGVEVVLQADRVALFNSHSNLGVSLASNQFARCYFTPVYQTGISAGAFSVVNEKDYIALPQYESTTKVVGGAVFAQEALRAAAGGDNGQGYGVNSGYLLPKGSFVGCTGPTENNWYQPIGGPNEVALSMFPIQSLITNMTASINDCSVTTNGDTLREQILLSQTRASLMQRTTPSKFDVYPWSQDDIRNANGTLQSYGSSKDSDIGNGSWKIQWINPSTGTDLPQFGQYTVNGVTVNVINYRPCFIPLGSSLIGKDITGSSGIIAASSMLVPLPVMFKYEASEPVVMSPFLWQDAKEMTECGLYGCTNISLTMNLQQAGPTLGYETATTKTPGRKYYADKLNTLYPTTASIMKTTGLHALFSKIALQNPSGTSTGTTGPFVTPKLNVTFLTPPPDVTLPLVSTVPYMEFPRYFSPVSLDGSFKGSKFTVSSNTITLSSIPDFLAVFVKPTMRGQTQNEVYIPISKIGVTFDNYSNLCSNFAQEDLYASTVAAGLDMDWEQWRGWAQTSSPTLIPSATQDTNPTFMDARRPANTVTQLSGGPLMLRMGQDVPLSPGLAPGTLGNFSVQLQIDLDNKYRFFDYVVDLSQTGNATIVIMAVNSGFFETVRGQSAIRKTILNSVDVEAASVQAGITSSHLKRLVGGLSGVQGASGLTNTTTGSDGSQPGTSALL